MIKTRVYDLFKNNDSSNSIFRVLNLLALYTLRMSHLGDILKRYQKDVSLSENGNRIEFEKVKRFSSHKRRAPCTVTEGGSEIDCDLLDGDVKENILGTSWREKYEAIKNEKVETSAAVYEEVEFLKKKDMEYQMCIKTLEDQLARDNNESRNVVPADDAATVTNAQHDTNLQTCMDKIKFYEVITGMRINLKDEGVTMCTVKNKKKRIMTKFTISEQGKTIDTPTLVYQPIANVSLLPDYLKAEIGFSPDLTPALIGDVIAAVFDE